MIYKSYENFTKDPQLLSDEELCTLASAGDRIAEENSGYTV